MILSCTTYYKKYLQRTCGKKKKNNKNINARVAGIEKRIPFLVDKTYVFPKTIEQITQWLNMI